MAKVISVNDITPKECAPCAMSLDNTSIEGTRLLVSRHYSISSKVNLEFIYDNGESKDITLAIGDEVKVKYTDDNGALQEVVGTITDIKNKQMSESFKSNTSMGNGNYILQFKIDASEEYGSNVLNIYLINIFDISPADIDPGEEPLVEPISWIEGKEISVIDGLLTIPYNRSEAGTIQLVVTQGEDVCVFCEEFEADSENPEATFTWSMRDFSSLNNTSIEGLNYTEDGTYVYHNGDNTVAEVKAVDIDNDKIIPAGTALNISISHFDSLNTESKINKVYTVTEEDVNAVISTESLPEEDNTETPDEGTTDEPVVETKAIEVVNAIENSVATLSLTNNTEEDITVEVNIKSGDSVIVTSTELVGANGTETYSWDLRDYSSATTEEEIYNVANTNANIVSAGEYTYAVAYNETEETGTITVAEENVEAAKKSACWIYNDNIKVVDKLLSIGYNRLLAGDVQLVVKANSNIVFKEEYTFSTINPNATFTWSMRDFSSLNNTSIEGLNYDEDGIYVYHNGDNTVAEVSAIDLNNDLLIPAGTELDITITVNNTVLNKTYTVTEEDVIALTN